MTAEDFQKEVIKLTRLGLILQATTIAMMTGPTQATKDDAVKQAGRIIDELTNDLLKDEE